MTCDLTRLHADATHETILEHIDRDGAVILQSVLDSERVDAMLDELRFFIDGTTSVGDAFAGYQTTRTGGLVLKSAEIRNLLLEPLLQGVARAFLAAHTERIQLSLTQIIRLLPGQGAQELHRDRFIWGRGLPRDIEPELNSIWALTEFTAEAGATRVVPGSHRWDWDRVAREDEVVQAIMPRGSVMLYSASVIHGGGENRSEGERVALNINLANAWLRQEENQYLSCPPERVRDLPAELQELLGYTMANYGLGYYSPPDFVPGLPDTLPPEFAVGGEAPAAQADTF